ncbi:MAG: hypothetical protein Q4F24_01265 [Eubacteriales bacterium]|nr:hypothetical protein [Eubacteriales bacterium]
MKIQKEVDKNMQNSNQEAQEKNNGKRNRRAVMISASILLAVCMIGGGLTARYISSNKKQAEMTSSQFHFTSNYLEEDTSPVKSYDITNWGDGFDIQLYNYEKENIAQIAADKINYTVTVSDGWACTDSGNGTMQKSNSRETKTLHIAPSDKNAVNINDQVTVTVTTTSPYSKELSAEFHVITKSTPDYTVADQNDGSVLLTIHTNDYSGDMTVQWKAEDFDPDNTNDLMVNWYESADVEQTQTISVEANHTYELLFFKNKADVGITNTSGSGTTAVVE